MGDARQQTELQSEANRESPMPRHVFVVGCPRSGTTWIQLLLAQHPIIATSQETHLFSAYLGHAMRVWEREKRAMDGRRQVGLTAVIGWEEFRRACRAFTDTVFDAIMGAHPGAELMLEKTPAHTEWAEQILMLYPEAAFVHVIRDPRDVVCSLRSAGASWGRHWAPTNVSDGARLWRERVESGLRIARLTSRYHEVRYEDLVEDAAAALAKVCRFLDLPIEHDFCRRAAEACRLDRLQADEPEENVDSPWRLATEPEGFFRRGQPRGWREELTSSALRRVEYLASPTMAELGYEPVTSTKRRSFRLALRMGLEWRFERVCRRIRGWIARI